MLMTLLLTAKLLKIEVNYDTFQNILFNLYLTQALKRKKKTVRISGARVLTDDKCAEILKECEEKKQKEKEEKEKRKLLREQKKKEKEEELKKKKAAAEEKKAVAAEKKATAEKTAATAVIKEITGDKGLSKC